MVFAAEYPLLEITGSIVAFAALAIWVWMVIAVLANVFERPDYSGWAKAGWAVFVIVLPFLGVLIYIATRGGDMARRRAADMAADEAELDDFLHKQTVPGGPPA